MINERVLKLAKDHNICEPWAEKILSMDVDGLLDLYVEGIDFSLSTDFLSNDFLIEHAGLEKLNKHGIYVDQTLILTNPKIAVCLGDSNITILLSGYSVSQVFAKSGNVMIKSTENSIGIVDCFQGSNVSAQWYDGSNLTCYVYQGAKVMGNAKISTKLKKTY